MIKFLTIREVAETGILPEWALRQRQKQGKLPGVYAGTRFYVDFKTLEQMLQTEALNNMKGATV